MRISGDRIIELVANESSPLLPKNQSIHKIYSQLFCHYTSIANVIDVTKLQKGLPARCPNGTRHLEHFIRVPSSWTVCGLTIWP